MRNPRRRCSCRSAFLFQTATANTWLLTKLSARAIGRTLLVPCGRVERLSLGNDFFQVLGEVFIQSNGRAVRITGRPGDPPPVEEISDDGRAPGKGGYVQRDCRINRFPP